jgi:hypothetical protein
MDIQPPKEGARTPKPPEEVLNSFIKDLDKLRQNVTSQLSQDVEALKNEKKTTKSRCRTTATAISKNAIAAIRIPLPKTNKPKPTLAETTSPSAC